jgi:hypothetical protein
MNSKSLDEFLTWQLELYYLDYGEEVSKKVKTLLKRSNWQNFTYSSLADV